MQQLPPKSQLHPFFFSYYKHTTAKRAQIFLLYFSYKTPKGIFFLGYVTPFYLSTLKNLKYFIKPCPSSSYPR